MLSVVIDHEKFEDSLRDAGVSKKDLDAAKRPLDFVRESKKKGGGAATNNNGQNRGAKGRRK
jgi:hypothetical protein